MSYEPIGAFSRRTGLSVRALRLYDELGVLRPAFVDPASGYRSYDLSQAMTATVIGMLRSIGMPLRDIAQVLDALAAGDATEAHRRIDSHWTAREAFHDRQRTVASSLHRFINKEASAVHLTIPSRTLVAALGQVVPAASDDGERPVLMSVLFEGGATGLRMVATDTYRMAVRDLPGVGVLDDGRQVLIPASLLRELSAALSSDEDVTMELGHGAVAFDLGDQRVAGETVEGSFPDYRAVLAAGEGHQLSADRRALVEVVERASMELSEPAALALDLGGTVVVRAFGDRRWRRGTRPCGRRQVVGTGHSGGGERPLPGGRYPEPLR